MPNISLLVKLRDGVAQLADSSAFRLNPDQMDRVAEWTPGTEIIVQEANQNPDWTYKLMSSGGGLPVGAAPHSASA